MVAATRRTVVVAARRALLHVPRVAHVPLQRVVMVRGGGARYRDVRAVRRHLQVLGGPVGGAGVRAGAAGVPAAGHVPRGHQRGEVGLLQCQVKVEVAVDVGGCVQSRRACLPD